MKILALLFLLLSQFAQAQSPVERFPWREGSAAAQEYPTYRQPWSAIRARQEVERRQTRWKNWFTATTCALVGSSIVYATSKSGSPSAASIQIGSIGAAAGLLAYELWTNKDGRRNRDYSVINAGVAGTFAGLTIQSQLQ